MRLAWGARVSPEFRAKVVAICGELQCDPSNLMACMAFETGQTFRSDIRNAAGSDATGLIQFMPKTAIAMGTTVDELAAKSPVDQLQDVLDYLRPYRGRVVTLSDLYMAIFMPSAIGKPDDTTLISDDEGKAYTQNRGLDLNKDGNITKAEAANQVARQLGIGLQAGNVWEDADDEQVAAPIEERSTQVQPEGTSMGASLVTGLIMSLLQSFTPLAQAKISQELGRHTDAGTADQVTGGIMNAILSLTGHPDPTTATDSQKIAAVAQVQASPPLLQQVEKTALQKFEDAAPWLDKLSAADQALWDAQNAGRASASTVAIEERKAGVWDMTKSLVWSSEGLTWLIVLGTLAPIIVAVSMGKDTVAMSILGFAGTVIGSLLKNRAQPFDYRFDGTKESATQQAAMAQIAVNKTTPGAAP